MVRNLALSAALFLALLPAPESPTTPTGAHLPSWAASVRAILSREGVMQPGDVFRVAIARSDLKVARYGVPLEPQFAYTSWTAVMPMGKGGEVMAMGDLVLTLTEVDPVMRRLLKGG